MPADPPQISDLPPAGALSLAGDVALVTGAARGLGFSMAAALAEAGARVHLNGRDAARLAPAVERLRARGLDVHPCVFDVADEAAVAATIAGIGRLDILVNNVGQRLRKPVDEIDAAAFRDLLNANLVAPFVLSKLAAEGMRRRGYGRIIMITSVAAERGLPNDAVYSAAKGGLSALMRAFASEWGEAGVTCNAISPGRFETETNKGRFDPSTARRMPIHRAGEPHEIGGACVFLASRAASYVTGAVLSVDGGLSSSA
jgi:gluconate 5-dehydrogenase